MKRLYVRDDRRGQGSAGGSRRRVDAAREIGYARMQLDTLPS